MDSASASRPTVTEDKYAFGRPHGISISQPLNPVHVSHVGLGSELTPSAIESISQLPSPRHPSPHGNAANAATPQATTATSTQQAPASSDGMPVALDPVKALLTKGPGSHIPLDTFTEERLNGLLEEMMV